MKESDKKKIGEAYLRLHSCNEEEGMTDEEAIKIIKQFRDRQGNSSDDNEAFDKAIKALEQQPIDKSAMMYEIYMEGVNMSGEYQGCWVRFKDIEKKVDKYMAESEESE